MLAKARGPVDLEPCPVLDAYTLIQHGGMVDFSAQPPWVAEGYRVFMAELRRGTRLQDQHEAAVAAMRAMQGDAAHR